MRRPALALVCLACASHARRTHGGSGEASEATSIYHALDRPEEHQPLGQPGISNTLRAFAMLLTALNSPAAAWQLSGHSLNLAGSNSRLSMPGKLHVPISRVHARHGDIGLFFRGTSESETPADDKKGKGRTKSARSRGRSETPRSRGKSASQSESPPASKAAAFSFPSFGSKAEPEPEPVEETTPMFGFFSPKAAPEPAPSPAPPPEKAQSPFNLFNSKPAPAPPPPPPAPPPPEKIASPFSFFGRGSSDDETPAPTNSAPEPVLDSGVVPYEEYEEESFEDVPPPRSEAAAQDTVPSGTILGAGVAGLAVGGVLSDAVVGVVGGLSGEALVDAAAVGGIAIGSAAAYAAATRPEEAGEAARFIGGAVANTTSAYAELAKINAELVLLEQQQQVQTAVDDKVQKVQNAIDERVAKVKAIPSQVQSKVTEIVEVVKAAPQKAVDEIASSVKSKLDDVRNQAKARVQAARQDVEKLKK